MVPPAGKGTTRLTALVGQAWAAAVDAVLGSDGERLAHLWAHAAAAPAAPGVHAECAAVVQELLRNVLLRLYPEAGAVLPFAGTPTDAAQTLVAPEVLERLP